MTISAWRIIKSKHAGDAFSGEGARRYGGRWNHKGTPIIYAASSVPLGILEMLVNLQDESLLPSYVVFKIEFEQNIVEALEVSDLPSDWRSSPAPVEVKNIGDVWFKELRSVVLAVPSAVTPNEPNYLFNPTHPDFGSVITSGPYPHDVDTRLLGLAKANEE